MTDLDTLIARVRELDAEGTARRAYLRDGPDTPYARRQRELLGAAFAVRDASGRVNGCAPAQAARWCYDCLWAGREAAASVSACMRALAGRRLLEGC